MTDPAGHLNYSEGYLDEEKQDVPFAWEDGKSVFLVRVSMGVR